MPTAFVCVTTDLALMVEVLEKVRALKGVFEPGMFYGIYDIIAEVKGYSVESQENHN